MADSGADRETITQIADQHLKAKNVVIGWCMGITHLHGTNNVQAIVQPRVVAVMVGREHAGLMPIRGHGQRARVGNCRRDPGS
ncbi:MAG: hypothetical protein R3C01_13165 [Planctomycetaceae bacterium]